MSFKKKTQKTKLYNMHQWSWLVISLNKTICQMKKISVCKKICYHLHHYHHQPPCLQVHLYLNIRRSESTYSMCSTVGCMLVFSRLISFAGWDSAVHEPETRSQSYLIIIHSFCIHLSWSVPGTVVVKQELFVGGVRTPGEPGENPHGHGEST